MVLTELIRHLEILAPPSLAESWDNTGLLLGDLQSNIERVLTCLTLTPDVAAEAVQENVQLVVTHHPLMFKPVQQMTTGTMEGRTLWQLARAGIAVYSPHTAWDNAPRGINQQLAELFDIADAAPLRVLPTEASYKLVTTVPPTDLEHVQQALWNAGCGIIGDYQHCSFYSPVTGTFQGGAESHPTVGHPGRLESVEELKLEVICPKSKLASAIRQLRAAHSYEEPAIDLYQLESIPSGHGAGRYGRLPESVSLAEFVTTVRNRLDCPGLQSVGHPQVRVEKVAFACGSAAEFWKDAQRAGCQVLLTGESRFHTALEVRDAGFAMIVAGHDATERFAMPRLADQLKERCPQLQAFASRREQDPFHS